MCLGRVCTILSCIEWQRFFGLRLQNDLWSEIPFICSGRVGSRGACRQEELLSQRSKAMPLYTIVLIVWRELWTAEDLFIGHSFFLSSYRLRFSANRATATERYWWGEGLCSPAYVCVNVGKLSVFNALYTAKVEATAARATRRRWARKEEWDV